MKSANFAEYMLSLCRELVTGTDVVVRQMAGVILKLSLDGKQNAEAAVQFAAAWRELDNGTKLTIKNGLFSTLSTDDSKVGHTVAQVIAKIAAIEIPHNEWPELIDALLDNMRSTHGALKRASLQALGYLCEAVPSTYVYHHVGTILTAVMQGMSADEPEVEVRLAGTRALGHALEFIADNFQVQEERDVIMSVVCDATQCPDTRVRRSALECIVKIIGEYYQLMDNYMEAIFQLSFEAIKSDAEPSALQAVEIFSTICEEEMFLAAMLKDALQHKTAPAFTSREYIKTNLATITAILLETMCRQPENAEEAQWSISMAAGAALDLISLTVHDDVLGPTVDFIRGNISSADWRLREAAVYAFGSLLAGVSTEAVAELVYSGVPLFAELMNDSVIVVGESAAWTLARICKLHRHAIAAHHFEALLGALNVGMQAHPRVASNCCWAVGCLATNCAPAEGESSCAFSPYFGDLMETLLAVSVRSDAEATSLRGSAYTAMGALITSSAPDCIDFVFKTFQTIVGRIEETLAAEIVSADDETRRSDYQALLVSLIREIIQKVGDSILSFTELLMGLCMAVFNCRTTTVHEETLLCVGALANAVDEVILPYLDAFMPVLLFGLTNHAEHNVCTIAVGVIGDLCRAVEDRFKPYCAPIMDVLMANLQQALPPNVKSATLAAFGDIASAVGDGFLVYFEATMNVLIEAANVTVDPNNADHVAYLNDLRENVLEGITGIVSCVKDCSQAVMLLPYAQFLFEFVQIIYADTTRNESVTRGALSALCDMASALGPDQREAVAFYLQSDWARALANEVASMDDQDSVEAHAYARKIFKKFGSVSL